MDWIIIPNTWENNSSKPPTRWSIWVVIQQDHGDQKMPGTEFTEFQAKGEPEPPGGGVPLFRDLLVTRYIYMCMYIYIFVFVCICIYTYLF